MDSSWLPNCESAVSRQNKCGGLKFSELDLTLWISLKMLQHYQLHQFVLSFRLGVPQTWNPEIGVSWKWAVHDLF